MKQFNFDYILKSSRRAKNIRIRINSKGEVILTKPWLIPRSIAISFLKKQETWITKQLEAYSRKQKKDYIYYLGKKYKINFKVGKLKIDFNKTSTLNISAYSKQAAKRALEDKFKTDFKQLLNDIVNSINNKTKHIIKRVSIKNQSTRWGSCSSKNNLNFNWRLVMAPSLVIRYVVIHEICHLDHMNHSKNFWAAVEKLDPDYRDHRRWLKRHGNQLTLDF
jgi:predicted metal-dependent hydrolase